MSRNGEICLKKIVVTYNQFGGASGGTRQFLATGLPAFKQKFPEVEIDLRIRRFSASAITGFFRDGSERAYNTKGLSATAIWNRCNQLVNEANDYNIVFSKNTIHLQRKTVQGAWNPWLFLADRPQPREEVPNWDRKLGDQEWDYYVDRYSKQMNNEERTIQGIVARRTELPSSYTADVQKRWNDVVAPKMNTDLEHNINAMKKNFMKGKKIDPVRIGEYRLFSVPDHAQMGQEAGVAIRKKEVEHIHSWWKERKAMLKPPK
eukprot:Tbor_TRINITY_DN5525_c0_g1::TRINITY_DN5525_c0_g1_i1::g.13690::m.13690/K17424/MRPL43; large subunit ribosomal protein L43